MGVTALPLTDEPPVSDEPVTELLPVSDEPVCEVESESIGLEEFFPAPPQATSDKQATTVIHKAKIFFFISLSPY